MIIDAKNLQRDEEFFLVNYHTYGERFEFSIDLSKKYRVVELTCDNVVAQNNGSAPILISFDQKVSVK